MKTEEEESHRINSVTLRIFRDWACPDCDHVHECREECGFYLGEGKFCHCPSRRAA